MLSLSVEEQGSVKERDFVSRLTFSIFVSREEISLFVSWLLSSSGSKSGRVKYFGGCNSSSAGTESSKLK
ncbi:hypothetical protein JTE90_002967 [Oedothorax gibbosus]|uniref:Uncharacterized protein n=1 Tax=Oedothorax gibbosus TaxID=931172 RepID=A0AAV6VGF3_9ARAC|nr:hypothetical protein JTE90_002967 [Oedothorax gibbosus]